MWYNRNVKKGQTPPTARLRGRKRQLVLFVGSLADTIEAYVLDLFRATASRELQLQRAELARRFGCAPSQVTYVLGTRFTPERGFIVESRRGSGGFVRLVRVGSQARVMDDILRATEDALSERRLLGFLAWLEREGLLSGREAAMIRFALARRVLTGEVEPAEVLRARLLRSMLLSLLAGEDAP